MDRGTSEVVRSRRVGVGVKVVCTGGTGFIGAALSNRLFTDGHNVSVIDDCTRGAQRNLDKGIEFYKEDIRAPLAWYDDCGDEFTSQLWYATKACDTVFHLAAINGTSSFYSKPADVLDVQVTGTANVIQRCVEQKIKTLVLFSSSEVYQTPTVIPTPENVPLSIPDITNPRYSYAIGKIAAEAMAWHSPIERVVVIRPHQVFGPKAGYQHVIPDFIVRADRTPVGGTFEIRGQSTRSFIYIDDFVDAMMTIWNHTQKQADRVREIYHVGTEEQVSMSALAGYVSDIMGKKSPGGQYAYKFKTVPGPVGGTRSRCPSVAKLRGLGWESQVSLQDGLKRTVEAYLKVREEWPE